MDITSFYQLMVSTLLMNSLVFLVESGLKAKLDMFAQP